MQDKTLSAENESLLACHCPAVSTGCARVCAPSGTVPPPPPRWSSAGLSGTSRWQPEPQLSASPPRLLHHLKIPGEKSDEPARKKQGIKEGLKEGDKALIKYKELNARVPVSCLPGGEAVLQRALWCLAVLPLANSTGDSWLLAAETGSK